MKTLIPALLALASTALVPFAARPADDSVPSAPQSASPAGGDPAAAPSPPPAQQPPAPPSARPAPPPAAQGQAAPPERPAPAGRWIWTEQYGWVWVPAGNAYRYDGADGTYAYVYGPSFGWTWVIAPWWGWGYWGWPHAGPFWWGPRFHRFGWGPGFRGPFRPFPTPRAFPAPRRMGRRM